MRVRFFYGWVIVIVTFVTMGIGVNARTAFSLFFPSSSMSFNGSAASPPARSRSASSSRRSSAR